MLRMVPLPCKARNEGTANDGKTHLPYRAAVTPASVWTTGFIVPSGL
jgi:hypothetical protein